MFLNNFSKKKEYKKNKILEAATIVFAEKGYHNATISDIVKMSGFSTGLVYSYFLNKLDILFSLVLEFSKKLNRLNQETLPQQKNPLDAINLLLNNIISLTKGKNLPLIKVINEALPQIYATKEKRFMQKQKEIYFEIAKYLQTIDEIIIKGQKKGIFDAENNPCILRTVFSGSIRVVLDGLYYKKYMNFKIGYGEKDAHQALKALIEKYIKK